MGLRPTLLLFLSLKKAAIVLILLFRQDKPAGDGEIARILDIHPETARIYLRSLASIVTRQLIGKRTSTCRNLRSRLSLEGLYTGICEESNDVSQGTICAKTSAYHITHT